MRINNNISAVFAYRQYNLWNARMANASRRLSSGLRINSAADDPAGLAISEKMRTQIRGLNVAARNCEDAISLVQTAEGAMGEMHAIVQRMRELAVQAASDTNDDTIDRAALDAEYQQLLEELREISGQTRYNGQPLLDGSADGENGKKMPILWGATSAAPGDVAALSAGLELRSMGMEFDGPASVTYTAATDETSAGANDATSAYLTISDGSHTYYVYAGAQGGSDGAEFAENSYDIADSSNRIVGMMVMDDAAANAVVNANATDGMSVQPVPDAHGSLYIQSGPNSGDSLLLSIGSLTPDRLGITGSGIGTQEEASHALSLMDRAVSLVSTERARLGAIQNRLEHKISNLNTQAENLSAAESRIRDADMAAEMMEYMKASIMAQAATAMLAQANNAPKNVLTLLQSL